MKKAKSIVAMLVICCLVLSSSGCATYRVHPEFEERHKKIHSVSIMKPEAEIYQVSFRGEKKLLTELMATLSQESVKEIKSVLEAKGYEVRELDLSEDVLKLDPSLRNAYFNVTKLFKKTIEDIKAGKKKQFTYDIGTEVNIFADRSGADVLIFTQESGFKKTAGEIAKEVTKTLLIAVATLGNIVVRSQYYATVIQLAVVDSNTGEILWYNTNESQCEVDPADMKFIKRHIDMILKPFPDSVFKKKEMKASGKEQAVVSKEVPVSLPSSPGVSPARQ